MDNSNNLPTSSNINKKNIIAISLFVVIVFAVFYLGENPNNNLDTVNKIEDFSKNESEEIANVDLYIRNNIKSIATNDPVLGGSWYVVTTLIDSSLNAGSVVYEDGHIQSSASFKYTYDNGNIQIIQFTVLE